jgi:hypothetical protein
MIAKYPSMENPGLRRMPTSFGSANFSAGFKLSYSIGIITLSYSSFS